MENYDGAIKDATSAIKYFDAKDFVFMMSSVGAITTDPDTCEESKPPVRTAPVKSESTV